MSNINHITKTDFDAFHRDIMKQEDKILFLEHISSCDYCSDQFAFMMSEVVIEAPKDLKANILKATKRPEVQLAIRVKETSKRMQLFIYSLKVGTATVLALLMLIFSVNSMDFMNSTRMSNPIETDIISVQEDNVPLTDIIRDGMDAITNNMFNLPNKIMNTEVINHD